VYRRQHGRLALISEPQRIYSPETAPERATLDGALDFQRETLAWKCSGLSGEQLRERSVPPSHLSLAGLLRHMTEVERGWFARTLVGEDRKPLYYTQERPDDDFDGVDSQDPLESYRLWREECAESRRLAASCESLDQIVARRRNPADPAPSLRWVMIHMIEEYARHNGHADLLRERLDGATGE